MKRIAIIIAFILALAGCLSEPGARVKHGDQLKFTTESSGLLAQGDLIGVTMDSPLSYRNVRMTFGGETLTPINPLYWPVDMPDSAVRFLAYYPYSQAFNDGGTVVFAANPDQRTDADFKSSGLLASQTKASVSDPSVRFCFEPMMSKLILYLRSESAGEIKDVTFSAYPSVQFNMNSNTVRVSGQKSDLHAHLTASNQDGVFAYETIIAPQNTTLSITVSTVTGDYSVVLNTMSQFASGKQYSNSRLIVLEAGHSAPYSFSVRESSWTPLPDFAYQAPISGGAELSEFSDPGIYKLEKGVAKPVRTFVGGLDQTSVVSRGGSFIGWRLQNPSTGEMFALSATAALQEGNSFEIGVRSFGLKDFESDFSSKGTVVKVENDMVWIVDENEKYGYIVTVK